MLLLQSMWGSDRPSTWNSLERRTCELCSWRGLASLPSRPMGELMRRRCDSVDAYVSRFSTCVARHPWLSPSPTQHRLGWDLFNNTL